MPSAPNFAHKLKKFLNWSEKATPEINLNTELYEQLRPFRVPIISVVLAMMFGTLGYVFIDDMSLSDAVYQSGITFTTVGFGEIAPISELGRLFTVTLIIVGFGVFSFSIGVLVQVLNKGDLIRIIKERSMLYRIARLKNHFVICYHNEFTIQLAKQFRENHVPFVVIDPSDSFAKTAHQFKYPYFLQEEPHTEIALLKSHFSSAKGMITLSENIADNIAQIASARLYEKELGLKRPYFIMANADNDIDTEKLKKLGADAVVSPTKLVAQRLSAMSIRPDMENMIETFLYQKKSAIDMEEIIVPDHSWMRFKKIKEAHLRDITNVSIVGIRDAKGKFSPMPKGDTLIGTGSKLLVVGTIESIHATKRIIRKREKPEELKYV
ncbi:MAG: NAD-binding protein [Campylobacterales bacterium]|nr:NAD-binding protein [Campylobacterales bacterium]